MRAQAGWGRRAGWVAVIAGVGGCSSAPDPAPAPPQSARGSVPKAGSASAAAAGAVAAGPGGAAAAPAVPLTPEEAVRGRTALFLDRLAAHDYAGLWALYDDELRARAGSEAEFLRHMKKQEMKPGLAQVLGTATRRLDEVTLDGERARAKVTLIVPERGPEEHLFEWRRDAESGEWCFLGEITAGRE